jgi:hypothetical protein
MQMKVKDFDNGLKRKHFVHLKYKKNNAHYFFYLEYPADSGEYQLHINTWRSVHPDQNYLSDNRIKDSSDELHFEKKKDFEEFLTCTFSFEKYIDLLKSKNYL